MAKKSAKKVSAKKSDKPKDVKKSKASKEAKVSAPEVRAPDKNQWKKDHIKENNITKPFFQTRGCVYRTSDGKPYSNPEELYADGGLKDWSNVHGI